MIPPIMPRVTRRERLMLAAVVAGFVLYATGGAALVLYLSHIAVGAFYGVDLLAPVGRP
jgi:hypothetical protein